MPDSLVRLLFTEADELRSCDEARAREILSRFQPQAKGSTKELAVFECLDNPRALVVAIAFGRSSRLVRRATA